MKVDQSPLYNDLASVQQLGRGGDPQDPQRLAAAARQFESMFVQMMTKAMRDANRALIGDSPFSSHESEIYQEMLDNQLSVMNGSGIGLAEVVLRQLQGGDTGTPEALASMGYAAPARNPNLDLRAAQLAMRHRDPVPLEAPSAPPFKVPRLGVQSLLWDQDATGFSSSEAFSQQLYPAARQAASMLGVDPRLLLSQAALETGWGQRMISGNRGENSFNLFGIKADASWQGPKVWVDTLEYRDGVAVRERAAFRAYGSYEESFADYARFIREQPRYQEALRQAGTPRGYIQALQQAGYATDPDYARKVMAIYRGDSIQQAPLAMNQSAAGTTSYQ